ncbi:THUMP domain-containing protein 1 [Eurytemora carolleeae]|uniref:THUMP domain-containing protein 1 n=1 Tax=Eurytemora carolleeae TaxID=1294199 RepID=UPI000C76163E|nr:THUMP domain-containing protein 1 [Eurytemora carolleeae]|eukprot:XP_023345775.1 THUMP domain-containing protein 1-like [Eurytemora affinis]
MGGSSKRKNKSYYANASKKARYAGQGRMLAENMRGFLLTCNNREKEAVREAYNLFNEYADSLYGSDKTNQGMKGEMINKEEEKVKVEEEEEEVEDIEAAFEKEKENLVKKRKEEKRFQMVESGANNCIFIKTTLQNPTELVNKLVEEIHETKANKARYILRLIPVLGTCKAYEKNMIELGQSVLKEPFAGATSPTFAIIFKTRNNNQVTRDDTIQTFAKVVRDLNPAAKVEFKDPDICIIIEIIRNVCCVGVVRNFYKYKKYNLVEIAKDGVKEETKEDNPIGEASTENAENNSLEKSAQNGNETGKEEEEIIAKEEVKSEVVEKENTFPADTLTEDG